MSVELNLCPCGAKHNDSHAMQSVVDANILLHGPRGMAAWCRESPPTLSNALHQERRGPLVLVLLRTLVSGTGCTSGQ